MAPTATSGCRDDLAAVMAAVAAGDAAAMASLWEVARPQLEWIVREALRSTGRPFGREVVEDAVGDAFVELVRRAGSWRPEGGAKPWNWARAMVRGCAFRSLGTVDRSLDDPMAPDLVDPGPVGLGWEPTPPAVEDPLALLEQLAEHDPEIATQLAVLRRAVPKDRDLRIFLRFELERAAGNRRPAVTVAALENLNPDCARQIAHRIGKKLGGRPGRPHCDRAA